MNSIDLGRPNAVTATSRLDERLLSSTATGNGKPLLTNLLSIFRRRKWVILGAVAGALFVGILLTLLMTPQYTASSTIEIKRDTENFTNVEGAEASAAFTDQEFYQTQYGLLSATSLAERVATQLGLADDHNFYATFDLPVAETWFDGGRLTQDAPPKAERVRLVGSILLQNMEVTPVRLSRLVTIQFTSPDPVLSKRVVDAWGSSFIQATLARRFEATAYARRFLEERLQQLRERLDQSERLLVDYATRQGIVKLPGPAPAAGQSSSGGERSLVVEDLVALNEELADAIGLRVKAQSRLGESGAASTEALENSAIAAIRQQRAEAAAEYAKLLTQFGPEYPPAKALANQISSLDRALAKEEARVRTNLNEVYTAALKREQDLRARVEALKAGVTELRRRSIQYNIYQRDADTNRQLYDALLQRYKEIGVAGGVGANNISIVDPAQVPQYPSSPNIVINMLLALMIGLMAGFGAAFGLEQMDQGVRDPGEVEDALKVPLLGTIPKVDGDLVDVLQDIKSAATEAYASLQTSLAFTTDHGVPKTIAVTSSRPGEGKSTTSYALAKSLARSRRRVVLVDGDMRSPSVHHLFGLNNDVGLSNFLAGEDDLEQLFLSTKHDGLFVMPAGPQPPSTPELLSSDRLSVLLASLLKTFDHVIVDAPPVMGLADAPLIGSRAEGVVFVLESHGTQKNMARVAIDRLRNSNVTLLGSVLTKFDPKRAHYGYGYDYGYGYGYGEDQKVA